jgi:membrane-associated phospholipid phosphatase
MEETALAPEVEICAKAAPRRTFDVRRSEWIILAFLIYAQALVFLLPVAVSIRYRVCLWNAAVIMIGALLIHLDSRWPKLAASVTRDWMPLALMVLAYREMGWFALPRAGARLESHWVIWDRAVLRGGGKAAIEALGPVLPSTLEIGYSMVYLLPPLCLLALYLYGYRSRVDRFLLIFVLGVLLCYAQFPFWPSEPPRLVFYGQDFPAYDTVFRRFNWWFLGNYGIHTSVFPSAHVAGAFSAAFGIRLAMPAQKWVSGCLFAAAILIAAATVYGRYHYLADAAAGFLMAVLAASIYCYGSRDWAGDKRRSPTPR